MTALNVDWYVGNCHKWLMAPKGSGFLYARPDRQDGVALSFERVLFTLGAAACDPIPTS